MFLRAVLLALAALACASGAAAPLPKTKPLASPDLIGLWELEVGTDKGSIEFREDGTYTAVLYPLVYVGRWSYRGGELQAQGKVFAGDREIFGGGGFYLKLDSTLKGETYDKYTFSLRKPK